MKGISWSTLAVRWALGLLLTFASLVYITNWQFYIADSAKVVPWLGIDSSVWYGKGLAVVFLLSGISLLAGIATVFASFTVLVGILVMHAIILFGNPYYNTLEHTVPMFLFACAIWTLADLGNIFSLDRWWKLSTSAFLRRRDEWMSLFIRLFVGLIALRQGIDNLFMRGGPVAFAERLYVKPFAGHLPDALLWLTGFSNPFILTVCGLAICLGLFTRFMTGLYLAFLISIIFGHLMGDPYDTTAGMNAYALNNFCFGVFVYYRHVVGKDAFSLHRHFSM